MSKFKVGDLAMVIGSRNFGRCVELISRHVGPCRVEVAGNRWVAVPDGVPAWLVAAEGMKAELTKSNRVVKTDEVVVSEVKLVPLRGDFQPEQQKAKEEIV
ncbi:hypothetical protein [Pseudomonas aeruginosa]|uniref:hypothetical protein n=1 Tax=Pseudomonas aeruginosa TaxID=287 RepID=UPI001D0A53A5|nr:hypothetical protein [Pseudomonas aeruginosa]MCC0321263.1 hypothetical protein [Pseudomonas aeruginosa]